jgi:hypothetical protein
VRKRQPSARARARLARAAFILEWITLAWAILEGSTGLWAGWQARSISLIASAPTA